LRDRLLNLLRYSVRLARFREWWEKLLHVAGSAFLLWVYSGRRGIDVCGFSLYVVGVLCLLLGGYAINDAADFSKDRLSGRDDGGLIPCRKHSLIVALMALLAGILLLFAATSELLPRMITIVTLLIGIEYSLRPLRFKERGVWGVITGAAMQRPALFVIFAAMLGVWNWLGTVLVVWLFCGGVLGMLGHQILDCQNDRTCGVHTFVTLHGSRLALRLCMVFAMAVALTVIAPLAFVPVAEALPAVVLLAALSSVYVGKGLRAGGRIRSEKMGSPRKIVPPLANGENSDGIGL